ncbi:hypothetical protein ACCC92_27750, partial [Mucilaginibacter sp. Mucisp84]
TYSFGMANVFSFAQIIPPGGIDATLWGGIVGSAASFMLALLLTCIAGLPKAPAAVTAPAQKTDTDGMTLLAPMSGSVLALDQVTDATFASGVL